MEYKTKIINMSHFYKSETMSFDLYSIIAIILINQKMKHLRKIIYVFGILLISNTIIGQKSEIITDKYLKVKQGMSEEIQKLMKKHKVVGLSLALVDGQETVWSKGFGYADEDEKILADCNTVYRIGSVSKLFTATATMQLAEQGVINIDSVYSKYVPEFSIKTRYKGNELITPRNMLTHHSGIPGDYIYGWTTNAPISSNIENLKNEYTCFKPNHVWAYSNTAVSLVGHMIEKIKGKDFNSCIVSDVFNPLDMKNSSFVMNDDIKKLFSKSYNKKGEEEKDITIRDIPAGTMMSNASDISNFLKMLFSNGRFNNNQILKEKTLNEMFRHQNANVALDMKMQMGISWMINIHKSLNYAGKTLGHGGSTKNFHTSLITLAEYDLGVVVMTNSAAGIMITDKIASDILKLAVEIKSGITAPPQLNKKVRVLKKHTIDLSEHNGLYNTAHGVMEIKAKNNKLNLKSGKKKFVMRPNTEGLFTIKIKLLGIPITMTKDLQFINIDGENIIYLDSAIIIGVRCEPDKITDVWKKRAGKYELLNKDDNEMYIENVELSYNKDLLLLKFSFMGYYEFIVTPLNNTEAITPGLGRTANHTFYITKDSKGNEILNILGFKLQKSIK